MFRPMNGYADLLSGLFDRDTTPRKFARKPLDCKDRQNCQPGSSFHRDSGGGDGGQFIQVVVDHFFDVHIVGVFKSK